MSRERLVHHELCFGCGRTNLFGLAMELTSAGPGSVRGRGFVKQDHQGPERGNAHEGVILAGLSDAMSLVCGGDMRATQVALDLHAPVPVGSFIEVSATAGERGPDGVEVSAIATVEGRRVACARGLYRPALRPPATG